MMALWLDPEELLDEEPESWPADGPVLTDCGLCGRTFSAFGGERLCAGCEEGVDAED